MADWQLGRAEPIFSQQWTYAALYDGLLAASKTTGDPRYHDAVVKLATRFDWKLLDARFPHADDMALGQSYMDLYLETHDPVRMADVKTILDRLMVRPDDPEKLLWWWCDALFMAPPVLARTFAATGDRRYLDTAARGADYLAATWRDLVDKPGEGLLSGPGLNLSLYGGLSGLAFVLNETGKETGNGRYREVARAATGSPSPGGAWPIRAAWSGC